MSSWGHGRMALNGAPTSSSSSSSGTPANNRLHPSCTNSSTSTSTCTSTSTTTGSASCTESEADHEELQSDHHKDCGHNPDSPLIAAISSLSDTLAHHSYHPHSLPSSKAGGAMPSASCHANNKQVDRQVEDPRRRLTCRNSNAMISSLAIASAPKPRHGEAPVTLERCLSKRDYHAVDEEKSTKRTNSAIAIAIATAAAPVVEMKPSSTVFKPHCSYNQEAPSPSPSPSPALPVRRPSWEEEVRQALTNSSLSGDGGRRQGPAKTIIGGGGSLQRSATVREHGSSHAMATALLPPTVAKKVAMEGMPAEEMDRFMKINNSKLPARVALPSKVQGLSGVGGAKRSTWSKVKSPGEQRWEEAEEFERMMQRSRKHRPIAAPMAGHAADMRSQSMRVQNSSDGTWNAHRQAPGAGAFGNSSSFYRGIDEEDADDEWVPYRRSGGGDGQIMYGAEPARRSVGANGFRYSAAASLAPPAGMVLGRSSSLRDPAIGMVMECGACGAPLRHRPQTSCCRSHCCPHHAPCPCSAWNEAPPPLHAGRNHPPLGSKKKFGTTTSSAAGSMIRACRRLFGLAKKNASHPHHHNQHHHHQLHYDS